MSARGRLMGVCLLAAAPSLAAAASAPPWGPESVSARLVLGHDGNLLDASDAERRAFETGDPSTFFVVDRMADQFIEGSLEAEWRLPRCLGRRPALELSFERQQYLHDPIKSDERFGARLRVRLAEGTRVDLSSAWTPQSYGRHRADRDALPGEPQFRPEVYRRVDLGLDVLQRAGPGFDLDLGCAGELRAYEAPFEERDRRSFGGHAGLHHTLGPKHKASIGGAYEAAWTRNSPGLPDDRSFRAWDLETSVETRAIPWLNRVRARFDAEWRRYTSGDPADHDHYGRRDRSGLIDVQIGRSLTTPLEWVTSFSHRWRSSNRSSTDFGEDAFEDTEVKSGVQWSWNP